MINMYEEFISSPDSDGEHDDDHHDCGDQHDQDVNTDSSNEFILKQADLFRRIINSYVHLPYFINDLLYYRCKFIGRLTFISVQLLDTELYKFL